MEYPIVAIVDEKMMMLVTTIMFEMRNQKGAGLSSCPALSAVTSAVMYVTASRVRSVKVMTMMMARIGMPCTLPDVLPTIRIFLYIDHIVAASAMAMAIYINIMRISTMKKVLY